MPRVKKLFSFAKAKEVTQTELEEVYLYLQKQLGELQEQIDAVAAAVSAPAVDYSYQIQLLNTAVVALQTQLAALQAQVNALNVLQFSFASNDDLLLITTPSGVRQVILVPYP